MRALSPRTWTWAGWPNCGGSFHSWRIGSSDREPCLPALTRTRQSATVHESAPRLEWPVSTVAEPQQPHFPGTEAEHGPKNVTGRLGTYAANRVRAFVGSPWQRRLSRGALVVPAVRR